MVNLPSAGVEPRAGEPDDNLVASLERVLEKARSGEIQGFAGVAIYRDLAYGDIFMGPAARSAQTVGGLTKLIHKICSDE